VSNKTLILDKILSDKRIEVADRKQQRTLEAIKKAIASAPAPRDFKGALTPNRLSNHGGTENTELSGRENPENICVHLRSSAVNSEIRLLAEVKKASPSKGLIRADFDPVKIAQTYEQAGASAVSVLTDEKYFQGHLSYLEAVRQAIDLPVLRKDFTVDPYQIYEARASGADAILLIVAALSKDELIEFMALATDLGMASLVETHTSEELDIALEIGARIIGVNNRNLQTFETKLETTLELADRIPDDRVLVSESGIFTRADVERLLSAGVDAILVGESLMREPDPAVKVRELLGK